MNDTVFIFLLGAIFCIVAVCPYLAWKISEYDENEDYYKRRKYVRIYILFICLFFLLWAVLMNNI